MKGRLGRIGRVLTTVARVLLWGAATLTLAGLVALLSVPAAVVSAAVALVVGWWSRTDKTYGALVGAACLAGGLTWLFFQPQVERQPLTSCSVYPIPFVQSGSSLPAAYIRPANVPADTAKPWVAPTVAQTYSQLQILQGAEQRIQQARTAAIAHARDTGDTLLELDSLLQQADARLTEQQLRDVKDVRAAIDNRVVTMAADAATEEDFRGKWQADPDVRRIANVALVLTNLDNEIARLFTGIQPPSYALTVSVRDRDLVYRETLGLTAVGGRFTRIDPSGLLEAARQRGLKPVLLWSPEPSSILKEVDPDVLKVPDEGSSSVVLGLEWREADAVVDTCRRMSALPFQAATVHVPGTYRATVRGEILPTSKSDAVPVAVTFTANNTLRDITLPAYSLFVPSIPLQASDPTGVNADEQVFSLVRPVTAESIRDTPFWIEMLPPQLRWAAFQAIKDKLFPANAAITLILLGVATLGSVTLSPRRQD